MTKLNTTAIEFRILDKKLNEAETVAIALGDLNVDPIYQMREKMDHDNIALYAESLEDLPPVRVFQVGNRMILVDGFHRYFAHELAEAEAIPAKVVEGSQFEAMAYAMAANFTHLKGGSKPTKNDQKNAIKRLYDALAGRFEYDSSEVIPTLQSYGITCTYEWIRQCTEAERASIDEKREAKITELKDEGLSQRAIASEVGCSVGTVNKTLKAVQKNKSCESEQEEAQDLAPEAAPFVDETSTEEPQPWDVPFDDEECEEVELVNPADAFNKALAEIAEDTTNPSVVSSDIPTNDNKPTVEETPKDEVAGAFNLMAEAWKKHGPDAFAEFLEDRTEVNDSNVEFFLKVASMVVVRRDS